MASVLVSSLLLQRTESTAVYSNQDNASPTTYILSLLPLSDFSHQVDYFACMLGMFMFPQSILTYVRDLFASVYTHTHTEGGGRGASVYSLIRRTFTGYIAFARNSDTRETAENRYAKPSTKRSPIHVVTTLNHA